MLMLTRCTKSLIRFWPPLCSTKYLPQAVERILHRLPRGLSQGFAPVMSLNVAGLSVWKPTDQIGILFFFIQWQLCVPQKHSETFCRWISCDIFSAAETDRLNVSVLSSHVRAIFPLEGMLTLSWPYLKLDMTSSCSEPLQHPAALGLFGRH